MGRKVEEEVGAVMEVEKEASTTASVDATATSLSTLSMDDEHIIAVSTCILARSLMAEAAEPFATASRYRPNMMIVSSSALVSKKVVSERQKDGGREQKEEGQ